MVSQFTISAFESPACERKREEKKKEKLQVNEINFYDIEVFVYFNVYTEKVSKKRFSRERENFAFPLFKGVSMPIDKEKLIKLSTRPPKPVSRCAKLKN